MRWIERCDPSRPILAQQQWRQCRSARQVGSTASDRWWTVFLQLFLAVFCRCSFTNSTMSCRPEKCCRSGRLKGKTTSFIQRSQRLWCYLYVNPAVLITLGIGQHGQHGQLHTTVVLQLAGTRCNPMPTASFAQVVAGASIQGPLGMRLCWGSEAIPNGVGWPHSSGMSQGQYLAESYVWHHSEFHRLKMSCNAMFGGSIPNLTPFAEVLLHALLGCLAGLHDARAEWHLCRSTS